MTSSLPTSNPSPISGRLGHQRVHWERSRTPWVSPKHLEASRSIFSSQCMQNRRTAIWQTQTFISPKDIPSSRHQNLGGAERDRTADPLLAKQVLSQLSYSPKPSRSLPKAKSNQKWWARADSNCRPHAYQACALTT